MNNMQQTECHYLSKYQSRLLFSTDMVVIRRTYKKGWFITDCSDAV